MYTIDNGFEIGEECYSVYRKPINYTCPICEGAGHFFHNGYKVQCKNCNGTGKQHNCNQYLMEPCKVRVRRIIANVFGSTITIKYKVDATDNCETKVNNRSENTLFKSVEEAEEYCKNVNMKLQTPEF